MTTTTSSKTTTSNEKKPVTSHSEEQKHMSDSISRLSVQEKMALESALPMWKIVYRQFKVHKMAYFSTWVILLIISIALGADLISQITGIDPDAQNVSARYLPLFSKAEATNDIRESAVEKYILRFPEEAKILGQSLKEKASSGDTRLNASSSEEDLLYDLAQKEKSEALKILSDTKTSSFDNYKHLIKNFSTTHVLGTDEVGRDIMMRLIYGARVSVGVGILVAISSALIGLLIGSVAGYYGGKVDMILMRVTDALLSLPTIPILIVFSAVDLQKLPMIKEMMDPNYESIIKMFVIMCLFSWMTVARLVRGSILTLREREFVLAAKTLGAKDSTIILRHMFPNVIAPMLVAITLGVGSSIIYESALSFLGLGIMPPTSSWGNMLNNAQEVIYKNVWLTILPGLMIFITTVCFNFIGDGLQDAVDPKAIKR